MIRSLTRAAASLAVVSALYACGDDSSPETPSPCEPGPAPCAALTDAGQGPGRAPGSAVDQVQPSRTDAAAPVVIEPGLDAGARAPTPSDASPSAPASLEPGEAGAHIDDAGAVVEGTTVEGPQVSPTDAGAADAPFETLDASTAAAEDEPDSGVNASADAAAVPQLPQPTEPQPIEPAPAFSFTPDKLDLLFVIDNSISMSDKQRLLGEALPDFIGRLTQAHCRDGLGGLQPANDSGACPAGTTLELEPVADLHVGVITTSLGGYGAETNCVEEQAQDMAHLLGTLPRGQGTVSGQTGFLAWTPQAQGEDLAEDFANWVVVAGELGCGWEASLEAWLRFLVEPYPYTKVVRMPCNASDTANSCVGPETSDGLLLVDTALLEQRAAFLRPDSLVSIVIFSDENDCSFKPNGQTWRLSQTVRGAGTSQMPDPAFRGTAACDDPAFGTNHECCHSCGQRTFPEACPSVVNDEGDTVAAGCEAGRRFDVQDPLDHPNLRCFEQKRRFGVDYLFPTARYVNALTQETLCPHVETLDSASCASSERVRNPLFTLFGGQRRPDDWLFLVGIVGVPWQDIARDPSGNDPLRYRSADPAAPEVERIDWSWVLGDPDPAGGFTEPADPLMIEQIEPRAGSVPATGEQLAPPEAGYQANSVNGHEWNIADRGDLQYACTFALQEPIQCPSLEEYDELLEQGQAPSDCDCTTYGGDEFANPLCQNPDGSYGLTQHRGKAYPGLRQLEVLRGFGKNSIVASICPKEHDMSKPDYGYRPALEAMLEGFARVLSPP